MAKTISSYEVRDGKIYISTPYCDDVVKICRQWAGKFIDGKWVVPESRLESVQEKLGHDFTDLVEVEADTDDWPSHCQQIHVGWYVLADRRGRDNRADVYADLVSGMIPESGGSAKNPRVAESGDTAFRFWVPRSFAVARELKIVTDPRATVEAESAIPAASAINCDALTDFARSIHVERAALMARLAEIDAILARDNAADSVVTPAMTADNDAGH